MENKINIAEILKNCPKGTKLYSPIFGEVFLKSVKDTGKEKLIYVSTVCNSSYHFYPDGKYNTYYSESECLLFPSKDQRDWSKFQRPFKDGDVVVAEDDESFQLFLLKHLTHSEDDKEHYGYCYFGWNFQYNELFEKGSCGFNRLATEEEKEKLFKAIKDNGYSWNQETKTLEKLVEPIFKVGNKIERFETTFIISDIKDNYYLTKCGNKIRIDNQDNFKLVPNKFDISTLKPFDKVLVRDTKDQKWTIDFFGFMNKDNGYPFVCVGHYATQCIPYEGNEHLLGKTDDCDEYYKTWE